MRPVLLRFDTSQIFGIDPRTLALFRVALASVLLSDIAVRARDINAFYTDAGVLPRVAQIELYSGLPALLSVHLLNGTPVVQWMLFGLAFGAALALLVGFRTRTATLISWGLLISLHNRNFMVLQGGDVLLRMMLFWSLFLPLHARASLDNWLAARAPDAGSPPPIFPNRPWVSSGTWAALLQVCFVYWFTALLKNDVAWRADGSAVGYALSIDQLARPLGRALLHYPDLLRGLTFFTLGLEAFGPWVALLPFWRLRLLMVLVFCGFHFIMGLCLTLGIFTWIAPTAWLLFVPSGAWDWLETRVTRSPQLSALRQSCGARLALARTITRRIAGAPGLAPPKRRLARARVMAGQIVAALLLFYVLAWNVRTLDFNRYSRYFPERWNWIGDTLRLDQVWDMFSPYPLRDDGWFVVPATLDDGTRVNLIRPHDGLNFGEPDNLSATFGDALWQKYMLNLWAADNAAHRPYYIAYLVRQWDAAHAPKQRVRAVELLFMRQTNLPGFHKDQIKKFLLWQQKF